VGFTGAPLSSTHRCRGDALGRHDVGAGNDVLRPRAVADDDGVVPAHELAEQVAERAVGEPAADDDAGADVGRSEAQDVARPGWMGSAHVSDTRATAP
jgi:hypothetical protein